MVGASTVSAGGTFADANAGSGKTVALSSTYGGADAGNYAIAGQASALAAITPKALTLSGLAAADKTYDGTTAAQLSGGTLVGLVGGETLSVGGLTGAFADKNAGYNKTVAVSGGVLADGSGSGRAANYTLNAPAGVTASIGRKAVTVSGITAADKVYDGTTAAAVSAGGAVVQGLVAGDDVRVDATGKWVVIVPSQIVGFSAAARIAAVSAIRSASPDGRWRGASARLAKSRRGPTSLRSTGVSRTSRAKSRSTGPGLPVVARI